MANVATQNIRVESLYSITDFLEAIKEFPPAPSFLKSNLFGQVETSWGDQVAVDYLCGSARTAPFTSKYKRAIALPRKRFQTSWFTPPDIKISRDIKALDLMNRVPGESAFNKMSSEERLAQWQMADYNDLDQQIARTEEKMCSDVLFTGKLVVQDGDDQKILQELDFGPINQTVIDPANYWDTANGNPLTDLSTFKRIVASSGYMPSFYVMGCDAASAFLSNAKVQQAYNQFNFRPGGAIDPSMRQEWENFGVSDLGMYWGMPLVSYEGTYEDPRDGKMHYFMPPDQVLVASKALPNRFAYGAVVQTEDAASGPEGWGARSVGTYMLPRVPQYVTDADEDTLKFRLWSRPLPVPVNTKTWSVTTVCTLKSQPIVTANL
jgi:hypothetical protein